MLFEPFIGLFFGEDGKNVNLWLGDVVINAEVINAKPILGLSKAAESLDARPALLAWLAAKMSSDCGDNARPIHRAKKLRILNGLWRKDDFISHSGQNLARIFDLSRAARQMQCEGFAIFCPRFIFNTSNFRWPRASGLRTALPIVRDKLPALQPQKCV